MAKQKVFVNDNGDKLILSPNFIYEVQIFRHSPTTYNLEDTKYFTTGEWVMDKISYVRGKEGHYTRHTTLVGAPLTWLKDRKYNEECLEKGK